MRLATVNMGTLLGRSREVVEMLGRRNVHICCLQEVRYRGQGTKYLVVRISISSGGMEEEKAGIELELWLGRYLWKM